MALKIEDVVDGGVHAEKPLLADFFGNRLRLELVLQLSAGAPEKAMSLLTYLLFNATSS